MSTKNIIEYSSGNGKESNNTNLKLILVDSTVNVNDIHKILQHEKINEIISFDYESHESLKQNNIPHIISDNFSSRNDLVDIQNNCYEYTKWFENDKIKQLTDYDGVNLGTLIQTELNYFLVQFVKKFFEVTKVFTKNNSAVFFASPTLFELIKIHTNSVIKINSENNLTFSYYDSLRIPLKIGGHTIILHLSKRQFNTLRKIFDLLSNLLLNKRRLNKKTILLIEFNPLRYKKLFASLSTVPLNFLMINRRKPAIWNFSSFSILRRSGCNVLNANSMFDNITKNRIKEKLPEVNSKIQSVWKYDDFFESFFSIKEISFWEALKPFFKDFFTKRAIESISEIEMAKRIFEKYKFDSILIWSEVGPIEQIFVKLAKKLGIKIILLQHGLFYDSESVGANKMNEFQGVYPIDADKYVVWGKVEEKNQIKHGTSIEKLMVLGSPLYDEISDAGRKDVLHGYVLLATSGPVKENALDLTVETIEKNQKTIKKICEVVTKLNKKLVIKPHPSQDEFDPSNLTKEISPNITVIKTGDIADLARSCDVFVMLDASTVVLDAHILKKPVISVLVKDSDYGIPSVLSQSCLLTDMDNFETTLKKVLTDASLRKTMIEKGTAYVNEYLVNRGSASTKLLNFLGDI